jgi:2',3'-cyclic-nucleotide 3'-phosphodiesterase
MWWLVNITRPDMWVPSSDLEVSEEDRLAIEKLVVDALSGDLERGGWVGGSIWLVPTYKPIDEWQPIAVKHLVDPRSRCTMAGSGWISTDTHLG